MNLGWYQHSRTAGRGRPAVPHFSGDDLYILAGPTRALDGAIRLFKWTAARTLLATNHHPVLFESAMTEPVQLPQGRGTDRAEAICDLPTALSGGKPRWLVLYDAPARIAGKVDTRCSQTCRAMIDVYTGRSTVTALVDSATGAAAVRPEPDKALACTLKSDGSRPGYFRPMQLA
ncbi:MAG: DUF3616 domain-containing protein [Proteobacteria bacterium]|nr:DUF3616 domain-containing protein [Burkholderiales bacterium]